MELKEGYKKTDVGVIPEDWKVSSLGNIGEVKMCKRIFSYQTKDSGDIPFYKIGTFGNEPDAYISKAIYEEFRKKYSFPRKGSILISAAGTIGRTIVYNGEDAYFQDSNIVWIENNNQVIPDEYLKLVFPIVKFKTEGGTIQRLYNSILKSGLFPLPPTLTEQKVIVHVLSDTEALIQALEKKIAKKKLIKKGVMQKLLTPKEGWEVKSLGEVIKLKNGYSLKSEYFSKSGPIVITPGNFSLSGGLFFEEKNIIRYSGNVTKEMKFNNGDLLIVMTDLTPTCNLLGKPGIVNSNEVILHNQRIGKIIITTVEISKYFLYYFFASEIFSKRMKDTATGSTVRHTSVGSIKSTIIKFPKLEEQTQIAQILSDIDTEIEQLKQKLAKYKLAKQGMMQQLLTGKIRLIKTKSNLLEDNLAMAAEPNESYQRK